MLRSSILLLGSLGLSAARTGAVAGNFKLDQAPAGNFKVSQASVGNSNPNVNQAPAYINWTTFRGNGVNLGGWLVQEPSIDTTWWATYSGGATDEWDLCLNLGAQCGPVLEERYASFITTADIDTLAAAGITVLRVPTTYAAWTSVPGSALYRGNQAAHLQRIAAHAIANHSMHVVVDLHSLPGGVNGLWIGEKNGNYGWFQNATNLAYSYAAVEGLLQFIQGSGYAHGFTLEMINEPVDNTDFSQYGTPAALTNAGLNWVAKYAQGVLDRVAAVNPKIPVMLQGSFRDAADWAGRFATGSNLVFDAHKYYFQDNLHATPLTAANETVYICEDAQGLYTNDTGARWEFPVYVGEWSIEASTGNTMASRKTNLNAGLYAFEKYAQGSAYWSAKYPGNGTVTGEGTEADYWDYERFIELGIVDPAYGAAYCS